MEWGSAQAAAAVIAGGVSIITSCIAVWLANRRARVDEKLARLKGEVDHQAADRRALVDERLATLKAQFERELAEQKSRFDNRLEFAAENVARQLMMDPQWRLRSFDLIKHHLGGFEDNDLRRILVRAGAIRFSSNSGAELWGLIERNRELLGARQINQDPGHRVIQESS